ncbi:MAG: cysteine desulfurase [Verrucomicrobiales bacterium]|nr:cysteine desulfurase [Verrucomicrobiales bacterium]
MSPPPLIYADYNATTPLDPAVREVIVAALDQPWANPSSIHRLGRDARATLDDARDRTAALWGCRPSEVVFTSGGTEANNLAVLGAARARAQSSSHRHLVCSPTEHHAVLLAHEYLARHEGFSLSWLPVDGVGRVHPEAVARALRPDTALVSVMAANNETGIIQPFQEIGRLCRSRGVLFHTDAVQFFGKCAIPHIASFEADLVSVCAHKLHGPKGAGALYIRSPLLPVPLLVGGAHEHERRAGTENLPAILGLVTTLERFSKVPVFPETQLTTWTQELAQGLATLPAVHSLTAPWPRLANTLAFTVRGADSIALLAALDLEGVLASSGSACSAGSLTPSHVLLAMGVDPALASGLVRLSLGRENTAAEVRRLLEVLPRVVSQVTRGYQ